MKTIIYQVLPRCWKKGRFSDWDKASFDYVKSMGCTHIWFTGIPRHTSAKPWVKGVPGSPYAISNYYDVNPYLADNEERRIDEFKLMVKRCHRNGVKVITDLVPNHIAPDYEDWRGGIPHYDWYDYDWSDTRKINYSAPDTWRKMLDIVLFWAELGVDGMRCDMVELVDVAFFSFLTSEVKKRHHEFIFIAEVYDKGNYDRYIHQGGFDYLYDKSGIYDSLRAIMCCSAPVSLITANWQSLGVLQPHMLNFLENHDEQRLASGEFLGRGDKAYAALAVTALFNNAALLVYAGQESGENAEESDNGRSSIFNANTIMKAVDRKVLKRYREILSLAATPLFSEGGNWDLQYCNHGSEGYDTDRHFSFLRYDEKSCALVFCNFSDTPASAVVHIPEDAKQKCHPSKDDIDVVAAPWDVQIVFI